MTGIELLPRESAKEGKIVSVPADIKLAAVIGLTALAVLFSGCSRGTAPPEAASKAPEAARATSPEPAKVEDPSLDEELPPAVRQPFKGDLDEMVTRRVVRVLVPFRRPEFFYMDGRPVGVLQEAFRELERLLNEKYKTNAANRIVVALLPTPVDKLRERMIGGLGDVAAYGIAITGERQALLDFTIPVTTGAKTIAVTGPGAPDLKSVEDLSGKEVWVHPETAWKNDLAALNAKLKSQGKAPAVMRETERLLDPGDIMELVNAGTYPVALMRDAQAQFWAQVFPNAKPRTDLTLAEGVEIGWAIQKNTPKLKAMLDDFIRTHGIGTAFGNTVMHRYLKEAKYVKNATEESEMKKFRETAPLFRKYATQYNFDTLLLVAQGYQESGLDQSVKSPVGAVGIMQVMPTTAAAAPVKVPDIDKVENNIHAGVRLVHYLVHDYFNEPELDRVNRTLFAIAAYNAGPAKIAKCRRTAKEMGYDPNKWFGNVEVATAKLVGRETTQYVANIYKYYIAYRMATQMLTRKQAAGS
jgi:membrane-bound lytic murein transglycosylase MltF